MNEQTPVKGFKVFNPLFFRFRRCNAYGRGLLGRCESGELYFGPQSDTPEKRRALLEPAMLSFARSIRKNHPEILK